MTDMPIAGLDFHRAYQPKEQEIPSQELLLKKKFKPVTRFTSIGHGSRLGTSKTLLQIIHNQPDSKSRKAQSWWLHWGLVAWAGLPSGQLQSHCKGPHQSSSTCLCISIRYSHGIMEAKVDIQTSSPQPPSDVAKLRGKHAVVGMNNAELFSQSIQFLSPWTGVPVATHVRRWYTEISPINLGFMVGTRTHVCMYVCMYVCMHVRMYAYVFT